MWVERVTARAFGPFRDATLELGPGLSVVVGPNEAGKSSWHAALRLALTGMRRGRGARTAEARAAEERHRPWDDPDGAWEVGAQVHLDDGRTIELSQDLAGKVDCRAVDIGLGRDVSGEIIVDGSPDASRWLGLDRHAFAATLSVDQARILAVLDAADGLQDDMQRAAATAGRDATAAEAIATLAEFRRAAVGADTRVAVGPLRQARQAVVDREAALAEARARHGRFLDRAAAAQAADLQVMVLREGVRAAEQAVAASRARALAARAARAAELAVRHPGPPDPLPDVDRESASVAAALEAWRARPSTAVLDGPDSSELERRLAAIPPAPRGDVVPHATVTAAVSDLDQAEGAKAELDGLGAIEASPAAGAYAVLGGGVLTAIAGVAAWVLGQATVGALLVAAGLVVSGWAILRLRAGRRHAAAAGFDLLARRREAAQRVARARSAVEAALRSRDAVVDGDVRAALAAYVTACASRAEESAAAAQAGALRAELDARRQREEAVAEAAAAVARAEELVRDAARRVGRDAPAGDPDRLAGELLAWQRARGVALRDGEVAIAEWQELVDLLDGRSLADLQAEAASAAQAAGAAGGPALDGSVAVGPGAQDGAATEVLAARRAALREAEQAAATLAGEVGQLRDGLPPVADAEEALGAAEVELQRVLDLAGIVDQTVELLRVAEERVHRDLAPVLARAVEHWLPAITDGAYDAAAVDPADLAVRVRETASGRWRDARRLSEGTREQVYLLLRMAMAEHLVTTGETAPLFLDEVSAQADDARRGRLLAMLHELSRRRQVVLFTHDRRIAEWLSAHLDPARDAVVRLAGPRVG